MLHPDPDGDRSNESIIHPVSCQKCLDDAAIVACVRWIIGTLPITSGAGVR